MFHVIDKFQILQKQYSENGPVTQILLSKHNEMAYDQFH